MKQFLCLVCSLISFAGSLAASAADAGGAQSSDKMTAARIIQNNVAARGGLKAWNAVYTLTLSGQLEAGGKNNTALPFVMKMKRQHKSRLEISFQDQTAVQVYDGTQGWKVRPFLGRNEVEPFTPVEAKAAEGWDELDGPLINNERKGIKVKLLGKSRVEGHQAYELKLTNKNGEERHLWVDAKSFLELKIDGEPRKMDGKLRGVAVYYRDFKKVAKGLTVPQTLETVVENIKPSQSHKMHIEQVAFNLPMEDSIFAKPQLVMAKVSAN